MGGPVNDWMDEGRGKGRKEGSEGKLVCVICKCFTFLSLFCFVFSRFQICEWLQDCKWGFNFFELWPLHPTCIFFFFPPSWNARRKQLVPYFFPSFFCSDNMPPHVTCFNHCLGISFLLVHHHFRNTPIGCTDVNLPDAMGGYRSEDECCISVFI